MVRHHDMHKAKEDGKSLRIRLALNHLYPEERRALEEAEETRRRAALKEASKGAPLGLEEE